MQVKIGFLNHIQGINVKNLTIQQELIKNYSELDLEKLPEQLRKCGFDYKLIKRENDKCIYSQSESGRIVAYEVFKTKIIKCRERMIELNKRSGRSLDKIYPEFKESFPNDEEFGKRAHSYSTLEKALIAYEGI